MLTTDSQRLLRICAGLRVDIKQMEVHHNSLFLQGKKQQSAQVKRTSQRKQRTPSTLQLIQLLILQIHFIVDQLLYL